MDNLSADAKAVLEYLQSEPLANCRLQIIMDRLELNKHRFGIAEQELVRLGLIADQDDDAYVLTRAGRDRLSETTTGGTSGVHIGGDVGPGAVVGSGSVRAQNIAGRDIFVGAPHKRARRETLLDLGMTPKDVEELRNELDLLLTDLQCVEDARTVRRATARLDKMVDAFGLTGSEPGPCNLRRVRSMADWLIEKIPDLAEDVASIVKMVDNIAE